MESHWKFGLSNTTLPPLFTNSGAVVNPLGFSKCVFVILICPVVISKEHWSRLPPSKLRLLAGAVTAKHMEGLKVFPPITECVKWNDSPEFVRPERMENPVPFCRMTQ